MAAGNPLSPLVPARAGGAGQSLHGTRIVFAPLIRAPNNHGNGQQHLHVITFHLITLLSVQHREPFRIFLRFPQVALSHPSPAY